MGFKEKKIMDQREVGRLLEKLGKDIFERGIVEVEGIRLVLPEKFEVELEYKEKHGKNKLEIEFKWYDESSRSSSKVSPPEITRQVVKIATTDELSPGKTINFTYPTDTDKAILIVLPNNELRAYSTVCTHKDKCVNWDEWLKKLHCPAHGAVFDPESGEKVKGPGGKFLRKVYLQKREDGVYAVGCAL
jgi:amphi-Trp domain-containing protein